MLEIFTIKEMDKLGRFFVNFWHFWVFFLVLIGFTSYDKNLVFILLSSRARIKRAFGAENVLGKIEISHSS